MAEPLPPGLERLVRLFAEGMAAADARAPIAVNRRSGVAFRPGIGPHSEDETVALVAAEWSNRAAPGIEASLQQPYPADPRSKLDLLVTQQANEHWAIEVKMLRMLGDNGRENDNMLMHILSPYRQHRSALTDIAKLRGSGFSARKAILIFGYNAPDYPSEAALDAFEALATRHGRLGSRTMSDTGSLIHPVHRTGFAAAWELLDG